MKAASSPFLKGFALLAVVLSFAGRAFAEEAAGPWLTDYQKALAQAKAENKNVLLDFTGSDWCGWCKKMVSETLSQPAFLEYASKKLVLVEVDFPSKKQLSDEVKKQNAELKKQFGARGYPTFVLVDKDGRELGKQVGYMKGGPEAFIAKLESFNSKTAASGGQ